MNNSDVKITERGWAGHFCCANQCKFRRNTLVEYQDRKIVVSSVGLMFNPTIKNFETVGINRHFETMAFEADYSDTRYFDADFSREIEFDSQWAIDKPDADDEANIMHDNVVSEIVDKLVHGTLKGRCE